MRLAMLLVPLVLSLAPPAGAQTDGVQVTPVVIRLDAGRGLSSIRLHNWRDREVSFEALVFAWRQDDGEDVHAPTSDVIVAPSVFAIPSGAEQIVRLALTTAARGAAPEREISYRLLLRELPAPVEDAGGFRVQLQMSLPVFVPPRATHTRIAAQRVIGADARPGVAIANTGSAHIRLASVTYGVSDEPIDRMPRYLLAGQSITRPLPRGVQSLDVVYAASGANVPISETLTLDLPTPALRVR